MSIDEDTALTALAAIAAAETAADVLEPVPEVPAACTSSANTMGKRCTKRRRKHDPELAALTDDRGNSRSYPPSLYVLSR